MALFLKKRSDNSLAPPPAPMNPNYSQTGMENQMDQPYQDNQNYAQPQPMAQDSGVSREAIEEVAEAIIDEKWKDLLKDIKQVIEWKEKSETRLAKMEQEIVGIKDNFNNLHKGVLGKIDQYDQNISNVGTEIKAMEKVFQKILPTFTENVNKLAMLTKSTSSKRNF